jgi:hypothetical protein
MVSTLFPDDDTMYIPFSDQDGSAGLMLMDPSIPEFIAAESPRKLLKNDGTILTQVLHSSAAPGSRTGFGFQRNVAIGCTE